MGKKKWSSQSSINPPTPITFHHHQPPNSTSNQRQHFTSLKIHLPNSAGPAAALEAYPELFHRPRLELRCLHCSGIVASPALPSTWDSCLKDLRSKFHQDRFATSTEGLLFCPCFHRNSALTHGEKAFLFLTLFFYFFPSLVSLHKKDIFSLCMRLRFCWSITLMAFFSTAGIFIFLRIAEWVKISIFPQNTAENRYFHLMGWRMKFLLLFKLLHKELTTNQLFLWQPEKCGPVLKLQGGKVDHFLLFFLIWWGEAEERKRLQ